MTDRNSLARVALGAVPLAARVALVALALPLARGPLDSTALPLVARGAVCRAAPLLLALARPPSPK